MTGPSEFLSALFEGKQTGQTILVWTPATKRSTWLTHDLTLRLEPSYDWYYGPGLAPRPGSTTERVKAADVVGIPALWADVDYADPVHKKAGLPTREQALELCDAVVPASLIVHTGHGYQAYWLLDRIWTFEGDSDRQRAAGLMQRWQTALGRLGYSLDATHDLSRVLRLPGTVNNKAEPVPVEMEREGWTVRYSVEELEELVADVVLPAAAAAPRLEEAPIATGTLVLAADAQPPADKWMALQDVIPDATDVYTRRKKFPSPSEYDLSLANYAVQAGWTDQEIVNLLIAARRRNGESLELNREDKFRRTIAKARSGGAGALLDGDEDALEPGPASELLDEVSREWGGLRITGVKAYNSDPRTYVLATERGEIAISGTKTLLSWQAMRERVVEQTHPPVLLRKVKQDVWERLVEKLLRAAEYEDGPRQTEMLHETLQRYFAAYLTEAGPDRDDAIVMNGRPHRFENFICFSMTHFHHWYISDGGAESAKTISASLALNFRGKSRPVNVRHNDHKVCRRVWHLPIDVIYGVSSISSLRA